MYILLYIYVLDIIIHIIVSDSAGGGHDPFDPLYAEFCAKTLGLCIQTSAPEMTSDLEIIQTYLEAQTQAVEPTTTSTNVESYEFFISDTSRLVMTAFHRQHAVTCDILTPLMMSSIPIARWFNFILFSTVIN